MSCCGQPPRGGHATPAAPGSGGPWVVDFPNGRSVEYPTLWQANAARATGGGSQPRKKHAT